MNQIEMRTETTGAKELKENNRHLFSSFMQFVWIASIAFVAYLSLNPRVEFPLDYFINIDKAYHSLAYLWLAAVPFFGFQRFKVALAGACLMLPMGIALEYAQGFVPGRLFSISDMIANAIGVILGVTLGRYLKSRFILNSRRVER